LGLELKVWIRCIYSIVAFAISIIHRDVHFILKEILEVGRPSFVLGFGILDFEISILNGGLAQLARAPALHAGGHRFDSDILHQALPGDTFRYLQM
tara:strand:+ start:265 stop:552 length:288 start_codon:yes stop_codon:yes gene_type:complete